MKTRIITEICNARGVPFNIVLVRRGDRYGLADRETHNSDDPLVEFYLAQGFGEHGTFIGRTWASTLLGDDALAFRIGNDVTEWTLAECDVVTIRLAIQDAGLLPPPAPQRKRPAHGIGVSIPVEISKPMYRTLKFYLVGTLTGRRDPTGLIEVVVDSVEHYDQEVAGTLWLRPSMVFVGTFPGWRPVANLVTDLEWEPAE